LCDQIRGKSLGKNRGQLGERTSEVSVERGENMEHDKSRQRQTRKRDRDREKEREIEIERLKETNLVWHFPG